MLIPKVREQVAHDSITASVIRSMRSRLVRNGKQSSSSDAPFQVGTDPITTEVLRSMKANQNKAQISSVPAFKSSRTFRMCDILD